MPNRDSGPKEPDAAPRSFRDEVRPADREVVRAIVAATGFFTPAEVEVAVELVDDRLRAGPASGYHFIFAEEHGTARGYACYGPIACTQGSYDLYWIAVEPSRRGKGLGKALLVEAERRIRAMGGRRVYIETSNRAQYGSTRGFYQRCGYHPETILKDFYSPGDDKVTYVKVLED